MKDLLGADPRITHEQNVEKYGCVVNYKAWFNADRLFVWDTRAVAHILNHPADYPKPEFFRRGLTQLLGHGLLVVEGDVHRQQRRVMSPAFGLAQIRGMTPVFLQKANQLRDIWKAQISVSDDEKRPRARVDAVAWLSRMTLDIIGLAGFNYAFDSLNSSDTPNEMNVAVRHLFGERPTLSHVMRTALPLLRIISTKRSREMAASRATLDRTGRQLLSEMKAAVAAEHGGADGKVERKDFQRKDLLSLLVRANMATDLPESGRMSDDDVLAQIPTLLVAGHETTSTAITWILYALSQQPHVQDTLRAELLASEHGDDPSMEALNAFPYLDAVVRETLRLFAPLPNAVRVATKDDVIPTEHEWTNRHGVKRSGVPISAGDSIIVPIMALNRLKDIWGTDASKFKPERWQNPPEAASSIPGVWGNGLAFLGGSRACIGYRFAVIETKATTYALVRAFRFSPAFEPADLRVKAMGTTRPCLASEIDKGTQLPLWISPVSESEAM